MINIRGIQVDVVKNIDLLLAEHAVFTIEFEYNNKLLVCHTFAVTVKRTLAHVLNKILGPKETNLDLRQALLLSEYITVDIIKLNTRSASDIFKCKYELIKSHASYWPYGYNSLTISLCQNERLYAKALSRELIEEIDKGANTSIAQHKNITYNKAKEVHAYNKVTGLYEKSYTSAKEASILTGICQSSISMCCNGYINTAGTFIWSFDKKASVELSEDRRKKQPKARPTAAEIAKRQQVFIKKNQ